MTESVGDVRTLVEQIAHALVDAPGEVQVTAVEDGDATVLELRVAATDLGKVIGKQGRTAKSIRTHSWRSQHEAEETLHAGDNRRLASAKLYYKAKKPGALVAPLSGEHRLPVGRQRLILSPSPRLSRRRGGIGEVAAVLLTDFPERFFPPKPAPLLLPGQRELSRQEIQLDDHWFHKGQVILKFAGTESISQAEELIGCEIQVPLERRTELHDGSFYLSDLTGC